MRTVKYSDISLSKKTIYCSSCVFISLTLIAIPWVMLQSFPKKLMLEIARECKCRVS